MTDASPVTDFRPPHTDEHAWQQLALGLNQRVRLMESLTQDLYGPQIALHRGLIPAALTLEHGLYLAAMRHVQPAHGPWLGMAWFDVAQDPTGLWWVLKQSTGIAPELVRGVWPKSVEQVPPSMLQAWQRAYPAPLDQPSSWVILDTSGVHAMTQSPLRSDCGVTWAHPKHLLVQGRQLWLRLPDGLQRVHGLILGQNGDVLDPLEIPIDVQTGITALFDALRHGQLVMINMPGLGFWNTPAWLGFLPALSRQWLNQDLILPSLPTWWLGEAQSWEQAWSGTRDGHLLPTYAGDGLHPAAMGQSLTPLDEYARALLRQQTDSQPEAWTLQTSWWGGKPWRIQVQADANGKTTLLNVAPTPNESSAD